MVRTAVINVVGLTARLLGPHTPRINAFLAKGAKATIRPAFPAVTCTAQSNYLTGKPPSTHGVVANGWYNRELAEVQFWKQSNHLVLAPKLWHDLRATVPSFTCAKLFWWFNMYADVDWSITPRPMYPADGRKVFDIYAWPYDVRTGIKRDLGEFPFPGFWGPAAGVDSPQGGADCASRWIAESAKWIERKHQPTLSLVYLPHLDYNLQRRGPLPAAADARKLTSQTRNSKPEIRNESEPPNAGCRELNPAITRDLRQIDAIVGDLLDFFAGREVNVILLSEYGITNVSRPVHLNRLFRERGWLIVKDELGLELLDAGASRVFAVADHQVAHVYVKEAPLRSAVCELLAKTPGVARVLDDAGKREAAIDHPRAGDLVAVAEEGAWFTYYYWIEDARAPDFARTVDIHRKPGYDPVELFTDPALSPAALKAKIAWRLLQKKLGFRMLMDVIPLDASLVKGSHGCRPADKADWPLLIVQGSAVLPGNEIESTEVCSVIKRQVTGP